MRVARKSGHLSARPVRWFSLTISLIAASLAGLPGQAGRASAAIPDDGQAFDPIGTWYVLVHYRDTDSPHADRWHWRDEVWSIERQGDQLSWVRHPIVNFEDTTRRFENLGTNRARRLIGAWRPNAAQRLELETGIHVGSRGERSQLLELAGPSSWRSVPGRMQAAASASLVDYRELWRIGLDGPVFEMRDSIRAGAA